MSLYFVRHGATAARPGQIVGHTDVLLSDAGRSEADAFAGALAGAWASPPPRLVTSDLTRAWQSAEPLAGRWGVQPERDARLREVDFGEWEGRTWGEVERQHAGAFAAWMTDWVEARPPGGESFAMLRERVGRWLATVDPGEPTLVVAHAGAIRALLCTALGFPLGLAFGFEVTRLRLGRLDAVPEGWALGVLGAWPDARVAAPAAKS